MHRIPVLAFLVCLGLLAAPAAQAVADITAIEGAVPPGNQAPNVVESVALQWNLTVDCFAVGLVSGSSFAAPDVLTGFDHVSWSQTTGTPSYAVAEGDPFPVLFFLNFEAPLAAGTEILVAGYASGNLISNVRGQYFGQDPWLFQNENPEWDPKGAVPEPGSLLLLGTGLAAAAWRRRRR